MHYVHPKDERHFEALIENQSAPEVEDGHEPSLQDELLDAGVDKQCLEDVITVLDRHVDRLAMRAASEALRRVAILVSTRGIYGAALSRVLGLAGEHSLTELASCLGVSKQAVHQTEGRLRAMLTPILPTELGVKTRAEIKRPTEPGEWVTAHEARRLTGTSPNVIAIAGKEGKIISVVHSNARFFREDSLLEWAEKCHLAKAEEEQARDALRQTKPVAWY